MDHLDASALPASEHYEARLQLVEAMDRLGFYSYHVAEHHGTPLGLAPSPNVYLAAVAQRTERLRFGPMVYVAALYHPMRLAEEICMLDQMSRGRLQVGIGRGAVWPEQEIYGLDPATVPERYAEAREILLQALTAEEVDFSGRHYRINRFPVVLRPYQKPRPPLWYGLGNPESAPWAAANDVNVVSLLPAALARRALDRYREEWARLCKPTAALPFLGLARHVVVADTDAAARSIAARAYPRWHDSLTHLWRQRGLALPLKLPREWEALESGGMSVAGTSSRVAEYLAAQAAAGGANFFLCQMVFGDMAYEDALRSLTLFARDVAPALAAVSPPGSPS